MNKIYPHHVHFSLLHYVSNKHSHMTYSVSELSRKLNLEHYSHCDLHHFFIYRSGMFNE